MTEARKISKTILKGATEDQTLPNLQINIQNDPSSLADKPLSSEEHYLKRKAEVTQQDHKEFLEYQEEKRASEEEKRTRESAPEQPASTPIEIAEVAPSRLN